ncbi:hypothetical protein GOBAR_DD35352 [Gossypium barbadense]|nr:hypothetical protein GOBAR_DD35352 [Gossypium barbadense]
MVGRHQWLSIHITSQWACLPSIREVMPLQGPQAATSNSLLASRVVVTGAEVKPRMWVRPPKINLLSSGYHEFLK